MMKFYKYQSVGNDFVLLDWTDRSDQEINDEIAASDWPNWVEKICNRQLGVGADGLLVVKNKNQQPEVLMFNADGSQAQRCFNGLRCAASFLYQQKKFPKQFEIIMQQPINCQMLSENLITINVGKATYQKKHQIQIANKLLQGHIVNIGNPHFVILGKVFLDWLKAYGGEIENHVDFPERTNVEFVWPENDSVYYALVYERGCGITQACGTGAAAIMQTLYQQDKILKEKEISLNMPGGEIKSYLDVDGSIIQTAPATMVYADDAICSSSRSSYS
jgi:diaminopimelate epimerase